MTGFYEFVLPALRRLSGHPPDRCRLSLRLSLDEDVASKGDRVRFFLARLAWEETGPRLRPVRSNSSADLVAGGLADGAFAVPAGARTLKAGTIVDFRPWRPLP